MKESYETEAIRVFVRIRPDRSEKRCVLVTGEKSLVLLPDSGQCKRDNNNDDDLTFAADVDDRNPDLRRSEAKSFTFDNVFDCGEQREVSFCSGRYLVV